MANAEAFFEENPPPKNLNDISAKIQDFIFQDDNYFLTLNELV